MAENYLRHLHSTVHFEWKPYLNKTKNVDPEQLKSILKIYTVASLPSDQCINDMFSNLMKQASKQLQRDIGDSGGFLPASSGVKKLWWISCANLGLLSELEWILQLKQVSSSSLFKTVGKVFYWFQILVGVSNWVLAWILTFQNQPSAFTYSMFVSVHF